VVGCTKKTIKKIVQSYIFCFSIHCLILNTFQVMVAVFIFFGCFIIDDKFLFFFQDFSRSEFKRGLLVYE